MYVRSLPDERWMLTLLFKERSDIVIVKIDSEQFYKYRYNFGWPHQSNHRKLINKMKVYDKKMLFRVHKLHKKLKYEINPKIQCELRIKYNKLKKRIN